MIYKYNLRTINQVKINLRQEIAAIKPEIINRVMQNIMSRLQPSIVKDRHRLNSIFKTHLEKQIRYIRLDHQ